MWVSFKPWMAHVTFLQWLVGNSASAAAPLWVVHVGSHLGLAILQVLLQNQPILLIEAVPPNWLYQCLNLARNLPRPVWESQVTILNAALTEISNNNNNNQQTSVTVPLHWYAYDTGASTSWPATTEEVASLTFSVRGQRLQEIYCSSSNNNNNNNSTLRPSLMC